MWTLNKLQKGDVLLYKGEGNWSSIWKFWEGSFSLKLMQLLIKIGTMSQYSHVGVVVDNDPKKVIVGEAIDSGFLIHHQAGYVDRLIRQDMIHVYRGELTNMQKEEIAKKAYDIQGVGYDWRDILDIGLHILTGRIFKFGRADKMICSEAVAYVYEYVNYKLSNKPVDEVTPADISRSLKLKRISVEDLK